MDSTKCITCKQPTKSSYNQCYKCKFRQCEQCKKRNVRTNTKYKICYDCYNFKNYAFI